jgi:hypothetical protein
MTTDVWLNLILQALQKIADRDYQNRIWVQGIDEGIVDSYIETMCNLFDDADVENFIANHAKNAGLSYLQTIELKKTV